MNHKTTNIIVVLTYVSLAVALYLAYREFLSNSEATLEKIHNMILDSYPKPKEKVE